MPVSDALDVGGQGGEMEGCAFDGVRAVGLLAQQAGRALGGGGLVVENEVLIAGDPGRPCRSGRG